MAASSDYVAEGDGFGIYDGGLTQHSDELPRHPIIQAAENGDIADCCELRALKAIFFSGAARPTRLERWFSVTNAVASTQKHAS